MYWRCDVAKKVKKGRPTSIRLLPETERLLMRCPGKHITDKFEYLVDFCAKREEILVKIEKEYQERFKAYEEHIKLMEGIISKFERTAQKSVSDFGQILNEAKTLCDQDKR
jgi:hypothetical protein